MIYFKIFGLSSGNRRRLQWWGKRMVSPRSEETTGDQLPKSQRLKGGHPLCDPHVQGVCALWGAGRCCCLLCTLLFAFDPNNLRISKSRGTNSEDSNLIDILNIFFQLKQSLPDSTNYTSSITIFYKIIDVEVKFIGGKSENPFTVLFR